MGPEILTHLPSRIAQLGTAALGLLLRGQQAPGVGVPGEEAGSWGLRKVSWGRGTPAPEDWETPAWPQACVKASRQQRN